MENNSIKFRLLYTLQAIIKYSDENHKLKSTQFNKLLNPYGFKHSKKALKDTVMTLNEFGFNVGKRGSGGVWLKEPLISEERLNSLVFAVQTNPYISKEQAVDALNALVPFISVYKEPNLKNNFENLNEKIIEDSLSYKYSVINDAIANNKSVMYSSIDTSEITFMPIKIRQKENKFYMVGYDYSSKSYETIDFSIISSIKLAAKQTEITLDEKDIIIKNIDYSSLIIKIK